MKHQPMPASIAVPYATVAAATQGFADECKIGSGGSCDVFAASIYGVTTAVKAISLTRENGAASLAAKHTRKKEQERQAERNLKQFWAEMRLLKKIAHPNICRLLATSDDGPRRCLILQVI